MMSMSYELEALVVRIHEDLFVNLVEQQIVRGSELVQYFVGNGHIAGPPCVQLIKCRQLFWNGDS
jgi:hypothetical protein